MSLAKYNSNLQILVSQDNSEESRDTASLYKNKVSSTAYHTHDLTHYIFLIGNNGQYYKYDMIDTVGLIDDVYTEPDLRNSVWKLFYNLSKCDVLVHAINAYQVKQSKGLSLLNIENEIIGYQQSKNNKSIICATFSDLKDAKKGIKCIRKAYPQIPVIPLSNSTGRGIGRLNRLLTSYAEEIVCNNEAS